MFNLGHAGILQGFAVKKVDFGQKNVSTHFWSHIIPSNEM